jgi:hypothetical protein
MIVKAKCINNSYMTEDIIPNTSNQMVWKTRSIPCNYPHLVVGEWYQFDVRNNHDELYPNGDNEYHLIVPGGMPTASGYIFSDKIKDEKYKFSKFFLSQQQVRTQNLNQLV